MSPQFSLKRNVTGLVAAVTLFTLAAGTAEAEKLDGDRLLDPNRLIEIRIELRPQDWRELCRQARNPATAFSGLPSESPYTYLKADLQIDGVEIRSVGVRKKGFFGSADVQRPSLKVKFDEFEKQDPIKGLSRLTLNNNKQDRSQASQFLTYQLFRAAGNQAPRSNWAHVIVNGESLGIYSNVESIKKAFLDRSFDDKSGNLYEGTLTDFYPKAISSIEAKTNEDKNDRTDIRRLAELLANDGELDVDELAKIIDLDSFFRHWVLESLTGFWDGYSSNQNNYFVYFNPKDAGRGHFIPWGADWVFSNGGPFSFGSRETTVIYAQSILTNRLYHTKNGPERYRATMERLLNEAWHEDSMLAEIDRIETLVTPHLHPAQSETPQAMDEVRGFIRNRREVLEQALTQWRTGQRRPSVPPEPRKPAYIVDVGKVTGSFSTTFSDGQPGEAVDGTSEIKIELGGRQIDFEQLSVRVQTLQFRGFGGPPGRGFGGRPGGGFGGPPNGGPGRGAGGPGQPTQPPPAPVSLVFTGTRAGGQPVTVSLTLDREAIVKTSADAIRITGSFSEGPAGGPGGGFGGFGGGGGPNRSVIGELRLSKSGTKPGDEIIGSVDFRIVETHGGLFQPQRPAGPQPQFGAPQSTTLLRTLDTDGDGTISAAEIERAAASLKRLDRDKDGNLSSSELRDSPASRPPGPGAAPGIGPAR